MHNLTAKEINQTRLLVIIPLIAGIAWSLFAVETISPDKAVPLGKAEIFVQDLQNTKPDDVQVEEFSSTEPDHVFINTASLDQLVVCPGIGEKTARKIMLERSYGRFVDWRDLKDRVKGLSEAKIEVLIEAGVRLDPK